MIPQESPSAWIGLVDSTQTASHAADCTCWKWVHGSPYDYKNFALGEPNNADGTEWCTEVYLPASGKPVGSWNDKGCGNARAAMCSVPANGTSNVRQATPTPAGGKSPTTGPIKTTPPAIPTLGGTATPSMLPAKSTSARPASATSPTTATKSPPCPSDWRYCPGASHCYKLVDGRYTQPQAQSRCRELGGNLATIDSAAGTQCLVDYTAQSSLKTYAWIGLVDPTENGRHAAGCTCWKWLDGSPYNYQNFEPREPNNVGGKEWCNVFSAGVWLDWNCQDLTVPALCSVPANATHGLHKPAAVPTRAAGQ
ncbi:macrophage mannose receptor 1-like protein [Aphelenchoides avenae]|nr:macrophage mannose receptor 1-like protein [Aphelenchus avenae]